MSQAVVNPVPGARLRLEQLRQTSPLRPAAWAFWFVVVAPATGAVLFSVTTLRVNDWALFGALAGGASLAQLSAVHLTRNRVFHPAIIFVVAGALVLSPKQLVVMCAIQHVPDWLRQRYAWYIQPFNVANYILAAIAAWAAAHAFGAFGSMPGGSQAAIGAAAAVAFVGVNRLLLAPMLRLGRGLTLRATGLFAGDDLARELVLALMAVPLVALWHDSVSLAALALTPLVLIYFTQRTAHQLELASETIGLQNQGLEAANELVIERSTAALEALSATVDARDAYTAGHSKRVRKYALALGEELGLTEDELETLSQAALLHDIGKLAVPDSVLLKAGALNDAEWALMKSHPEQGAWIIERLGYLDEVVPAIRHHHERPDARGYPQGLGGDEIPLVARIIHVADALDAMTTKRPYRATLTFDAALDEIRRGSGTDFCADCAQALERSVAAGLFDDLTPLGRDVAA